MDERCFICGYTDLRTHKNDYLRCLGCGHETLATTKEQGFINNDFLSIKEVRRVTRLDRFKERTLKYFDNDLDRISLLDIGAASGKFLFHNSWRYKRATGIEITLESICFARKMLGLEIVEDIDTVRGEISTATAWHSFEHIPKDDLLRLIESLANKMPAGGRLLVSVPNAESLQYQWFGRKYAYYDVPNHLHQFTPNSLKRLMERFRFVHVATVNSWA